MKATAKTRAKPKNRSLKKTPAHADLFAGWDLIDRLASKAQDGHDPSLQQLILIAYYATANVWRFPEKDLIRFKKIVHTMGRFGVNEELPIIWSWQIGANNRVLEMLRKVGLGESLPYRAMGAADEFYIRLIQVYLPMVRLKPGFEKAPTDPSPQECRKWARAIADLIYPKDKPRAPDPVDLRTASPESLRQKRMQRVMEKQARRHAAGRGSGMSEEIDRTERELAKQPTYGEFRTRFTDTVAARLKTIFGTQTLNRTG